MPGTLLPQGFCTCCFLCWNTLPHPLQMAQSFVSFGLFLSGFFWSPHWKFQPVWPSQSPSAAMIFPLSLSSAVILFFLFICLLSVFPDQNVSWAMAELLFSLLFPQHPEECLAHDKHSINICWMSEWIKRWVTDSFNWIWKNKRSMTYCAQKCHGEVHRKYTQEKSGCIDTQML